MAPVAPDGADRKEHRLVGDLCFLERFFAPDELISQALEVVTEGIVLYNDMTYHQKASALKKSKTLTGSKKKQQEDLYKAYVKNIQTKEIRETVESEG